MPQRQLKLLLLALLIACGDDGRFVGVGAGRDAEVDDGGGADGGSDGSSSGDGDGDRDGGGDGDGDGGNAGDGDGDGDGGGIEDLPPQCEITSDDAHEISVEIIESGFAISPGATGFGLAYAREACQQALDVVRIGASGPFDEGTTLVDDCRTVLDVGLAKSGTGFQLAYTDNSTDSVELHTIELNAELEPVRESQLTDNTLIERRPAIADVGGAPLVAYITEKSYERAIATLRVSEDAEPVDLFQRSAGRLPIELDISPVGMGAGLVWVEEAGQPGIWYQRLDAMGAANGSPQQLSSFAAPNSTIDVTRRVNDGGAIVFAIGIDATSQELRFQRLSEDGLLRGDVVKLVSQPLQGKDAGIAAVAGGYAIAYRALPDGETITEPQIRIAFITKYGRAVRDRAGRIVSHLIAPAQHDGSRVHLEVSTEGQLLLAFVDGNASGASTLRLIRRTLGCAL